MKITTTLITLIGRLTNEEIKGFRNYLLYKKRKKVLELLNVFVQSKDEEELSSQIKRKKLTRNLRQNQNDLFKLLRKFWVDNANDEIPRHEVSSMIDFAVVIYERGLIQEAIKLLRQAEQKAKENSLNLLEYQSNHKLVSINWLHDPDQTEKLMSDYLKTREDIFNKIELTSKVSHLYQRGFYLFFRGIWSLSEEQFQFLTDSGKEIESLLENKLLDSRWRIVLFSLACNYARFIQMDSDLAIFYGRQMIEEIIAHPPFPDKDRSLASAYSGLLIILLMTNKKEDFNKVYDTFTTFYNNLSNRGLSIETYLVSARFQYLAYNGIFDEQMESVLAEFFHFMESEGKLLSPIYLGPFHTFIFELYYCSGQFEKAMNSLDLVKDLNDATKLPSLKFTELFMEILINYENQNYEFIINRCLSFIRRYSKFLKFNPVGDLLLKYFIKLSKAQNKSVEIELFKELKTEIIPLLSNIRNRTMVEFWNIVPVIDSKINQVETVEAWLKMND